MVSDHGFYGCGASILQWESKYHGFLLTFTIGLMAIPQELGKLPQFRVETDFCCFLGRGILNTF